MQYPKSTVDGAFFLRIISPQLVTATPAVVARDPPADAGI